MTEYITEETPRINKYLEKYIWKVKMNKHEPYSSRAEHDFYKQLSAQLNDLQECVNEGYKLSGKAHQIIINMTKTMDLHFIENMKRRRASDRSK